MSSPIKDGKVVKSIRKTISKKPFTEVINGTEYTYSLLEKKNKSFVLTNLRLLVLKGIWSIGYVRTLPQQVKLPFTVQENLQPNKIQFPLADLENITTEQDTLILNFNGETEKTKWEFICPSKNCALEWRRIIELALENLKSFNASKYQKYQDYVQMKKQKLDALQIEKGEIYEQLKKEEKQEIKNNENKGVQKQPGQQISDSTEKEFQSQLEENKQKRRTGTLANKPNQNKDFQIKKTLSVSSHPIQIEKDTLISKIDKEKFIQTFKKKPTSTFFQGSKQINQKQFLVKISDEKSINKPTSSLYSGSEQIKLPEIRESIEYKNEMNKQINQKLRKKSQNGVKIQEGGESQQLKKMIKNLKSKSSFVSKKLFEKEVVEQSRQTTMESIQKLRRDWIQQTILGMELTDLLLDFRSYAEKITETIINQLELAPLERYFSPAEIDNYHMAYEFQDITVILFLITDQTIEESGNPYYGFYKKIFENYNYFALRSHQLHQKQSPIHQDEAQHQDFTLLYPFMTKFQFKGFLGFARNKLTKNYSNKYDNKELYNLLTQEKHYHRKYFQNIYHLDSKFILNQDKVKITKYSREKGYSQSKIVRSVNKSKNSKTNSKISSEKQRNQSQRHIFFIDKLEDFLPFDTNVHFHNKSKQFNLNFIRGQLIEDEEFEDIVFHKQNETQAKGYQEQRDTYTENDVNQFKVSEAIPSKVKQFIKILQNQEEYFMNSNELVELFHNCGINMRYLGLAFNICNKKWLQKIFKSELIARCMKLFYLYDMQDFILQYHKNNKSQIQSPTSSNKKATVKNSSSKSHQIKYKQKQYRRFISFLNIALGDNNNESTYNLWEQLNIHCKKYYKCSLIYESNNEHNNKMQESINIPYLYNAIQYNFQCKFNIAAHILVEEKLPFRNVTERSVPKAQQILFTMEESLEHFTFVIETWIYSLECTKYVRKILDCIQNIEEENSTEHNHNKNHEQFIDDSDYQEKHQKIEREYVTLCQLISYEGDAHSTGNCYLNKLKTVKNSQDLWDRIIICLYNFISPESNSQLYEYHRRSHENEVFEASKVVTEGILAEIKWILKSTGRKNKAYSEQQCKNCIQQMSKYVNYTIGVPHPVIVECYIILCSYYSKIKFQFPKAISYCKKALELQSLLLEDNNHHKISDIYLIMANTYLHNQYYNEALQIYSKVKFIIDHQKNLVNQDQEDILEIYTYCTVSTTICKLYLQNEELQPALTIALNCYKLLKEEVYYFMSKKSSNPQESIINRRNYEQYNQVFIEIISIIARVFQIDSNYKSYIQFLENQILAYKYLYIFVDGSPNQLEQLIKIIIFPYFTKLHIERQEVKQYFHQILHEIIQIEQHPNIAFNYIKKRISDESFPSNFINCLSNIEKVLAQVKKNQMIERWKGLLHISERMLLQNISSSSTANISRQFDFLAAFTALAGFLSGNFIEGIFEGFI